MTSDVENLFMCLFFIWISLVTGLLKDSANFKDRLVFLIIVFWECKFCWSVGRAVGLLPYCNFNRHFHDYKWSQALLGLLAFWTLFRGSAYSCFLSVSFYWIFSFFIDSYKLIACYGYDSLSVSEYLLPLCVLVIYSTFWWIKFVILTQLYLLVFSFMVCAFCVLFEKYFPFQISRLYYANLFQ